MAAGESTLPAEMTVPFDFIYRTLAVEGCEIFSSAFLEVLAKIVFKLALVSKLALLG